MKENYGSWGIFIIGQSDWFTIFILMNKLNPMYDYQIEKHYITKYQIPVNICAFDIQIFYKIPTYCKQLLHKCHNHTRNQSSMYYSSMLLLLAEVDA